MLKNLLDACGASVAFFAIGYALAFGGTEPESPKKTFIGTENFFLKDVDDLGFWMFQYAFSAASVTIVAGTLAERCQMAACRCTRMPCVCLNDNNNSPTYSSILFCRRSLLLCRFDWLGLSSYCSRYLEPQWLALRDQRRSYVGCWHGRFCRFW
jgi:Ammonium Transporter Family